MNFLQITWNQSAVTIDDLYNPKWVYIYGIYWDVTLFITTIFFAFMLYAIIKKSTKEMGTYKWYLCHQLFWSYLFDCHMSLWKPVALWPFYMGYSAGIYSNLSGKLAYVPLVILSFLIVGMGVSIAMSLVHRFVQATPLAKFTEYYNIIWLRVTACVGAFIFFSAGIGLPVLLTIPDLEVLKKFLINQNPAFEILYKNEPSMFGYAPETNGNLTIVFLFALLGIIVFLIIVVVAVFFNYLNVLRQNKSLLSETTFRLQVSQSSLSMLIEDNVYRI